MAFNDTNDLLTWHITQPYRTARRQGDEARVSVEFANVFVQNDVHWLVFETPRTHNDYFKRFDVWQTILCGAEQGHVLSC